MNLILFRYIKWVKSHNGWKRWSWATYKLRFWVKVWCQKSIVWLLLVQCVDPTQWDPTNLYTPTLSHPIKSLYDITFLHISTNI
jgi:hypothetical protein